MQVLLNGQPTEIAEDSSLAELLRPLRLGEQRYAVEVNGDIVPRSRLDATHLRAGDRIEVVQAIGGG